MKIFSPEQIREWDQYTMEQPISPEKLMERAASQCTKWILNTFPIRKNSSFSVGRGIMAGMGRSLEKS